MEKNPQNDLVYPGERVDDLQNGLYVIQNPEKFCFGMDAVLLSGFADIRQNEKALDMGTGTLTFHAVSYKVIDIPTYIQKLDDTGLFESVNYSGYNFEDNEYSLMLTCVLKAAETGGDQ